MASDTQIVRLAPLGGVRSDRVSDPAVNGVFMRGGFNVELKDSEWWTRHGEELVLRRIGSTQWTFMGVCNAKWVIANPYWALQLNSLSPESGVTNLYSPTATDTVDLTQMSTLGVCSAHTPSVGQLVLVGPGYTTEVYRVVAAAGTSFTLERPYEGLTGNYICRFLPQLAQGATGTNEPYYDGVSNAGSGYVVFEQLVTHAAGDMHATSPAVTAGRRYLIITSILGCPVAIDLGVVTGVKRNWFFRTGLSSGTETNICSSNGYGFYAETFGGRLWIGYAPDNNNRLASRTIWYSKFGDFLQWHVGNKGYTASPNFVTFPGPNNDIAGLATLRGQLVVHRQLTQEIGSETQSSVQPVSFSTNDQHLGIYRQADALLAHTRGAHFIWTLRGPAVYDGSVSLIAPELYRDLNALFANETPDVKGVVHDEPRGRLYWILGESNPSSPYRHQDATMPATGGRLLASGYEYASANTVLAHDFEKNEFWFEDRAGIYGGGYLGEPGTATAQGTYVSRFDGTIVKLKGPGTGMDPGVYDSSEDHVVEAQVDTPWLDLGVPTSKKLQKVEIACRALHVTADTQDLPDKISDVWDAEDDRLYLRLRVYGDYDETNAIADVETSYLVSDMLALSLADNRQMPLFILRFTPDCSAATFKFRVSNTLSAAASAAGLKMAPFRLSEFVVQFVAQETGRGRKALNAA